MSPSELMNGLLIKPIMIVRGNPMFILQQKLKHLKPIMRDWNINVFGDIHQQVILAHQKLEDIQLSIDRLGYKYQRSEEEIARLASYNSALQTESYFWKEKAKHSKFIDGYKNTNFFHKITKLREKQNLICILKDGDETLSTTTNIEAHALQ